MSEENPKLEFKIKTELVDQEIHQTVEEFGERVRTHILNVQEEQIKQALIQLGWSPPEEMNVYNMTGQATRLIHKAMREALDDPAKVISHVEGDKFITKDGRTFVIKFIEEDNGEE